MRLRGLLVVIALVMAGCMAQEPDLEQESAPPVDEPDRAPGLPPAADPVPVQASTQGPAPLPPVFVRDPLAMGPLEVLWTDYDFGQLIASDGGTSPLVYPVQVRGEIAYPDGEGPFPVVLLMHGRHGTCSILGSEVLGTHVCPDAGVVTPVDSYTGYRYLADNLASHGYVVASIDANQINDRDQLLLVGAGDYGATARAQLVLRTLEMLAEVHETGSAGTPPAPLPLEGRLDLERIGLMGHSRGGEGVARALGLNQERDEPFAIQAVFALAPTDFRRWDVTEAAFATLLPYCDGDVYNLQGSWMYDDARQDAQHALYQVVARGANHNWYNTVWTNDDWGTGRDPWCGSASDETGRDTMESQQTHGLATMASFLRMHVGGEGGFLPYWTGEASWPEEVCTQPCDRLLVSHLAPADERLTVSWDGSGEVLAGDSTTCSPASCPFEPTYGTAEQTWFKGGTDVRYLLPAEASSFSFLTLRIATGLDDVRLTVRADGSAEGTVPLLLEHPALDAAPGDQARKAVASTVPVRLDAFSDPAGLVFRFEGGDVQVLDVVLQ